MNDRPDSDSKTMTTDDLSYSGDSVEYYDALYAEKDYDRECDVIEQVFDEFADGSIESVLDLGCGTGGHLLCLSERGYEMAGVDVSPRMIECLRSKCETVEHSPELYCQSIDTLDVDRTFDAAICMFSVLNYLTTNEGLQRGFERISDHLGPDGVFVADIWYGPAVLAIEPEARMKRVSTDDGTLFRFATPTHDPREHLVEVAYDFVLAGETTERCSETHDIRYLFPKEIELYLDRAGLELETMFESFDRDSDPGLDTWSVTVVATQS